MLEYPLTVLGAGEYPPSESKFTLVGVSIFLVRSFLIIVRMKSFIR